MMQFTKTKALISFKGYSLPRACVFLLLLAQFLNHFQASKQSRAVFKFGFGVQQSFGSISRTPHPRELERFCRVKFFLDPAFVFLITT